MIFSKLVAFATLATAVYGLPPEVERLRGSTRMEIIDDGSKKRSPTPTKRAADSFFTPTFSNPKAANFHVDSSSLPLVTFDLQDSWAGRLPISSSSSESRVSFYLMPEIFIIRILC